MEGMAVYMEAWPQPHRDRPLLFSDYSLRSSLTPCSIYLSQNFTGKWKENAKPIGTPSLAIATQATGIFDLCPRYQSFQH